MSSDWLLEEYKLLQSKIDKIGEDRFKVRTWSVTLTMGLLLGAKISSVLSPAALSFAFLTVIMFHLVEHKQRGLGKKLGDRALKLEALIRNRAQEATSESGVSQEYSPKIAVTLRSRTSAEYKRNISWGRILQRRHLGTPVPKIRWTLWDWCVVRADNLFYGMQYFMLICALVAILCSSKPSVDVAQYMIQITNSTVAISLSPDFTDAVIHVSAVVSTSPSVISSTIWTQSGWNVRMTPGAKQPVVDQPLSMNSNPAQDTVRLTNSPSQPPSANAPLTDNGVTRIIVASNGPPIVGVPSSPSP